MTRPLPPEVAEEPRGGVVNAPTRSGSLGLRVNHTTYLSGEEPRREPPAPDWHPGPGLSWALQESPGIELGPPYTVTGADVHRAIVYGQPMRTAGQVVRSKRLRIHLWWECVPYDPARP